jgi:hypothetical protein
MDAPISVFIIAAVIFLVIVGLLWRYWQSVAEVSASDESFSRRIARLNERQSNRIDDDHLRNITDDDEAWRIMVDRGRQSDRLPTYSNTTRRARERQRRQEK